MDGLMDNIIKKIAYQRYEPMIKNFVSKAVTELQNSYNNINIPYCHDDLHLTNSFKSQMKKAYLDAIALANKDFFEWNGRCLGKELSREYLLIRKTILDNVELYIYNRLTNTRGGI